MTIDVLALIKNVRQLFYSLYDKYAKFYGPSLNINLEQRNAHSVQAPTNPIGMRYQLLFQKTKHSRSSSLLSSTQHKTRLPSFKII